jgi:3-dehydroquinate synthase
MVSVSCNIKRKVVELDPTEKGDRALLNFGHTLGHAIEKLMNFTLYHGECVVLGMVAALNICVAKGTVSKDEYDSIINVFASYDFPLTVSGITIADVVKTSKSDKKMDAGKIKFILLKELGNAYIDRNVSDEELAESLEGIVI